jgi:hypothetical protein
VKPFTGAWQPGPQGSFHRPTQHAGTPYLTWNRLAEFRCFAVWTVYLWAGAVPYDGRNFWSRHSSPPFTLHSPLNSSHKMSRNLSSDEVTIPVSQPDSPVRLGTTKLQPFDDDVIDFESPEDPYNAINWPFRKKVFVTMLYSFCTMCTTWASTMCVTLLDCGIPLR